MSPSKPPRAARSETRTLAPIAAVLSQHRSAIIQKWLAAVLSIWNQQYSGAVTESDLQQQSGKLLDELDRLFSGHAGEGPPEIAADSALAGLASELSVSRAKAGFRPADTAQYVIALKAVLTDLLHRSAATPEQLVACLLAVNNVIDRLSLLTFDAFVEARERVISQQSLSLRELSTPVIRLWDQVLMLPLVGVIDTQRARQFTERLLEAITRHEAAVTILDVTGVPVFDTSVARHIMRTVDAAQLLGTRIVITGISPEGAQTLTKLGVSFAGVTCRATLRAGIAEALRMIGRRVVAIAGAGS
jgi:rsbT co-antagonist protein RsbR